MNKILLDKMESGNIRMIPSNDSRLVSSNQELDLNSPDNLNQLRLPQIISRQRMDSSLDTPYSKMENIIIY